MKPFLSDLRISSMALHLPFNYLLKLLSPILDWILGIRKLRKNYEKGGFSGLDKQEFCEKLLNFFNIKIDGEQEILKQIPKEGGCIIVCNHPHGFIEGIAMLYILYRYRQDTKSLSNVGLEFIKELHDYFIFIHNLRPNSRKNRLGIRQCFNHIKAGGLLLLFPAGKVSHYQKEKKCITDSKWNPLAIHISKELGAPILPVFISGQNSALYQFLGRIHSLFRLILLPREMMRLKNYTLKLNAGNLIKSSQLNFFKSTEEKNDFLRMQCYLNDTRYLKNWTEERSTSTFEQIIPPVNRSILKEELSNLPSQQHLLDKEHFSVYYGFQNQIPSCVREITRLREITFRELNEGSGLSRDTDRFDATYIHLFIYNHKTDEIIGAYRMGQTDVLLKNGDICNLYLSDNFEFKESFTNRIEPCLELGRSFVIKPYQKYFFSLFLLWKGIGAFIRQNPHYKTLYGTVSLSKLYSPCSVSIIEQTLIRNTSSGVKPKNHFENTLSPEIKELLSKQSWDLPKVSALISGVEPDGKHLPVLLKKYYELGATFHCISIDINFNDTPGLFLSVDLNNISEENSKLYMNDSKDL